MAVDKGEHSYNIKQVELVPSNSCKLVISALVRPFWTSYTHTDTAVLVISGGFGNPIPTLKTALTISHHQQQQEGAPTDELHKAEAFLRSCKLFISQKKCHLTIFIWTRHWSLSWARLIHFIAYNPISMSHIPFMCRCSIYSYPFMFPSQIFVWISHMNPFYLAHLFLLIFTFVIILGE